MQRNCLHIVISAILLFFHSVSADAADKYLSTAVNGLSSQICYNVIKGDEGCIWVSTRNGVDRYDGRDFAHYQLSDKSERTLSDGFVLSLYQCSGGRHPILAFSERNIIYRFNPVNNRFEQLLDLSAFEGMGALQSIYSSNGCSDLVVGMSNGLAIYDLENKKLISHIAADYSVHTIVQYDLGHTNLVGTQKGLMVYDISKHSLKSVCDTPLDINCLFYESQSQMIWIGTNGQGLWKMKKGTLHPTKIHGCTSSIITAMTPLDEATMLVATDGDGVYTIGKDLQLNLMASDIADAPNFIPARAIKDVLVDDGQIWIAMYMGGVQLLSPVHPFQKIMNPRTEMASDAYLFSADCDVQGNLWTAYNQALVCYSSNGASPVCYMNGKAQLLAVEAMTDGSVWCGGFNSGLYHLWPKTGRVEHKTSVCGNLTNDCVYALLEDDRGNLWVGGLNMKLTCIHKDGKLQNFDINYVYDLCKVNQNLIAVATCEGFYTVNTQTGKIKPYLVGNSRNGIEVTNDAGQKEVRTATNYISALTCRNGHELWLATDGAGLACYDLKTDHLTSFGLQRGLPSLNLRSVELLNDSILCVSTEEHGLFSFNCHTRRCVLNLQPADGLDISQFYQNSSCLIPGGKVMFGGNKGGIVLSASDFSATKHNFAVRLMCADDTLSQSKVHLPYDNRSLTVQVFTTDIYHQNEYHFFYRLKEVDTVWHKVDESRQLHFLSLPAGSYTLCVKAVGVDNQEAEANLSIMADREPWLRWYAFLLYILLTGAFVYMLFRLYRSRMKQEQSDEKIRFFSSVAHDIRTPLSLVTAPLYELENQAKGDTAMQEQIAVMKRNVGHLTQIVDHLTSFNRFQEGKAPIHLVSVHLQPLLDSIHQSYEPLAHKKGLVFGQEFPSQAVWVRADVQQLGRALDNLLGNAFKYTAEGAVTVQLTASADEACIEVRDTGMGMSEESQKKLFRQFFRGENVANSSIPGCGVGLLFTYQLVRSMGGNLTCQSELGRGSSFCLTLPLATPETEEQSVYIPHPEDMEGLPDNSLAHLNYNGLRYSILVVEDNVELQMYLAKALHERYNVFRAGCVSEAQQVMSENSVDLIISDIMMPGMRGDEWCAQLKGDIVTSHIPVILLTALADMANQIKGLGGGADDYITKPFDMSVLLLKVGNIFQQRKRMHAYYVQAFHLNSDQSEEQTETDDVSAQTPEISTLDDQFLEKLMQVMDEYVSQSDVNMDQVAQQMNMSHTLFYDKVRKLLDMSPAELLRNRRMNKAMELLKKGGLSVTDVAIQCGYADARYFGTVFKKHFGILPSKVTNS